MLISRAKREKGLIEVWRTEHDSQISREIREINERYGIKLSEVNQFLEELGYSGNYSGRLEGTPFEICYVEECLYPPENLYHLGEQEEPKPRYNYFIIEGIEFGNQRNLDALASHSYITSLIKVFNEDFLKVLASDCTCINK